MLEEQERLSDPLDVGSRMAAIGAADKVAEIRRRADAIPKGEPGECIECGLEFSRVVHGYCGRCRDALGRP